MKLAGKRIWLTGASSGIGLALAKELARRGASLALSARNAGALTACVEGLHAQGSAAAALPGDVTSLQQMKDCAARAQEILGAIDILIANAGTHIESWPERFNSSEYKHLMDTNYGGMLNCFEAVLPAMQQRSSGVIVGIASLAGFRGLPRAAAYGASKSAMITFMESIRFHLRPQGIRVVIVNPGFVKTPLTDKNDFHMPFLISAERAAEYICDSLEREKNKISFPAPFTWLLELARIIPFPLYDLLVERQWQRMKKTLR